MKRNLFQKYFGNIFSYPAYTERDLSEFDADSARFNTKLILAFAKVLLLFLLVFWPTDFLIYWGSKKYLTALMIWRIASVIGCLATIITLSFSDYFRVRSEYIFIICADFMTFATGYAIGMMGGTDSILFYSIYPVPFMTTILIVRLPIRTLSTFSIPAAFFGGAALYAAEIFRDPYIWTPIIYVSCSSAGAICIGQAFFHLLRINFLQRLQLSRVNDELEDKVEARTSDLSAANITLKKLASDMTDIQEKERTRISHDIHDELGQLLSGLRMKVYGITDTAGMGESLNRTFKDIDDIIRRIQQSLRRIMTGLHPIGLEGGGFISMLNSSLDDFRNRSGVKLTKRIEIDDRSARALGNQQKTAIFRIVQEALTNIERHSRARAVDLSLTADQNGIRIAVADDGIGFDSGSQKAGKGLGLFSMQERTRMLGGEFRITSAEGEGTGIEITVPLDRNGSTRPGEPL